MTLDFNKLTKEIETYLEGVVCDDFKDMKKSLFENDVDGEKGWTDGEEQSEELFKWLMKKVISVTIKLID